MLLLLTVPQEMIHQIGEEFNFHKKEVYLIRGDKDMLEHNLQLRTVDVKRNLTNELFKVEEEMKRHYAHQRAENSRL